MSAAKSSRVNRKYKTKYRIRNWSEYERGLRNRGDVTIWLSEEAIAAWTPAKNGLLDIIIERSYNKFLTDHSIMSTVCLWHGRESLSWNKSPKGC